MSDPNDERTRREACAQRLHDAQQTRTPCAPLTAEFDLSPHDAYAIQQINIERRLDAGAVRAGWKIGLTSHAIQSWLNVDEPDYGTILDEMIVPDRGDVDTAMLLQPRAEGEVVFVMKHDLEGPGVDGARVIAATDFVLPAIEIIDSRIADWKIQWADTVADNASSAMLVFGSTPIPLHQLDLRLAGMTLRKNGRVVSTGAGAACLGHPVNAVAWLANKLWEMGTSLRAGDVVLSGALGPVTPVAPGDALDVEISGLGSTGCRFS